MKLLFAYTFRNLAVRKLTTSLTVVGMGLVVFVFAAMMMFAYGIEKTLTDTGSDDNAILVRKAATSETVSLVMRSDATLALTQPEIAVGSDGAPIGVAEIVILVSPNKIGSGEAANVIMRGTSEAAMTLRPNIKLEGRMFTPGTSEIIAGRSAAKNFEGCQIGGRMRFAERDWIVVGTFDAGGSGFDSEVWGDVNQVQQAFRRTIFSSVTVRLKDRSQFDQLKQRMESDPRMTVDVKGEKEYYAAQSEMMASFITIMGIVISVVFSAGAMIGAMITMYSAVANRTAEIGTLRAIGFARFRILVVFMLESLWIALLGAVLGLSAASLMSFVTVSTTNWGSFSELAFSFALSPGIVIGSLIFAIAMGLIGGFLPAVRASRAKIVDSLRAA
jgi:ABC-type antimicrobial peptide transport system permease subunit